MIYGDSILTLLSDLIEIFSTKIENINYYFDDLFYDRIDEAEVDFLSDHVSTKNFNNREKMIIYHSSIIYMSVMFVEKALLLKKSEINFGLLKELFPLYNLLENHSQTINLNRLSPFESVSSLEETLISLLTEYVNSISRKKSGTEITPLRIVDFMLDSIEYLGPEVLTKKILDPACGSGRFISAIVKRFFNEINDSKDLVKALKYSNNIHAFDLNPVNVFISKIVVLLNAIEYYPKIKTKELSEIFSNLSFFTQDALRNNCGGFDYVVGNPPYIRLQNVDEVNRDYIKKYYNSATGRFDVYVCFIEAAINALKHGGKLSFITSNKYLTANYGVGIRNFLINHLSIKLLFDLTDTKFFEAAVLPAILTGIKENNPVNTNVKFCQIKVDQSSSISYEYMPDIFNHINSISEKQFSSFSNYMIDNGREFIPISISTMIVKIPEINKQWNFSAEINSILKRKIEKKSDQPLSDLFEICVGIKTTADSVFVKPLTDRFIADKKLESDLIYSLIQSTNVNKWKLTWDISNQKDRHILYPYVERSGKTVVAKLDDYPNIKSYLLDNQLTLKARSYLTDSKTRLWYEIWVPQSFQKFHRKKIVTRDIVSRNTFALDFDGNLCQGNTFFLYLKEKVDLFSFGNIDESDLLFYYSALLNSDLLEFYQKLISGSLYSKKFRYTTANLSRWPIIKYSDNIISNRIIEVVKEILSTYEESSLLEHKLNELVSDLYGINNTEKETIRMFLNANS